MSTRALARIYDDNGQDILVTIYKHFDGYPESFGKELKEFAYKFRLTNGFTLQDKKDGNVANGMGCFAAFLIRQLKKQIGDVYICPTSNDLFGAEYLYRVKPNGERIVVTWECLVGGCNASLSLALYHDNGNDYVRIS